MLRSVMTYDALILAITAESFLVELLQAPCAARRWQVVVAADLSAGLAAQPPAADVVVLDDKVAASAVAVRALGVPVLGLGVVEGADVGLDKPVRLADLMQQLSILVNRPRRVGPWRLDLAGRRLLGEPRQTVRLTDKEAAILALLYRANAVVARDVLLASVWGYGSAISTHTLETHIYRLRRKMEPDPALPALLLTEDGGYRLRRDDQADGGSSAR